MTVFHPGPCKCGVVWSGGDTKIIYCHQHKLTEEARADALTLQSWVKENGCTPSMMKSRCDILQGQLNEALGALGYAVPADTPDPPRYKCGLCESRNFESQGPGSLEYEIEQEKRSRPYKGYQP